MSGSKCYGLIVNKSIRAIFCGVFIILIGLGVFIEWFFTEYAAMSFLIYIHLFGITVTVLSDHFSFGGICSKDMGEIGFLKSALHGLDVLKKAVFVDFILKSCCSFVLVAAPIVIGNAFMGYEMTEKKLLLMFTMVFAVLFSQTIGILIGRHMSTLYVKMMASSIFVVIAVLAEFWALIDLTDDNNKVSVAVAMLVICASGYLISSVLSFIDVNRVLNRSFYDQK